MTDEADKPAPAGDEKDAKEIEINVPAVAAGKSIVNNDLHVRSPPVTEAVKKLLNDFVTELEKDKEYVSLQQDPAIKKYCSENNLYRYLRARSNNISKAKTFLLASLQWRKTNKPQDIKASEIEKESVTGKMHVLRKDRHGRPVLVMDSSKENTKNHEGNLKNLMFHLERATKLMDNGVEKYMVFINLENYSFWSAPPFKTSRETNTILADRFPERLGQAVLWKAPRLFSGFWTAISPFVDSVTKSKIYFMRGEHKKGSDNDKLLTDLIGEDWREICGIDQKVYHKDCAVGYNHEEAWKQVCEDEKKWAEAAAGGSDKGDAKSAEGKSEAKSEAKSDAGSSAGSAGAAAGDAKAADGGAAAGAASAGSAEAASGEGAGPEWH